jgi:peptidoglycan/LPS O-acetylase OafA/YrhL
MAALAVKVIAASSGFLLAASYLTHGRGWSRLCVRRIFQSLAALAAIALTAAAILRWFS